MRFIITILSIAGLAFILGFSSKNEKKAVSIDNVPTIEIGNENTLQQEDVNVTTTNQAEAFVSFAKTLIGTPYLYGSMDASIGLDCSGFINAVSKHFGIKVPRSSVEFTNIGTTIDVGNSKPGDLILFTGTDVTRHVVGHMGIITENNNGDVQFIHSSSGKANGVTISSLEGYYQTRFVKVIRIFPTNKMVA